MNEDRESNSSYKQEMHSLLVKLGFYAVRKGIYGHSILSGIFNFSASSLEGIPVWIYNQAFKEGKEEKLVEIKKVLNIG